MKVLITGANGFVGKNLCATLMERKDDTVITIGRESTKDELQQAVEQVDFIFSIDLFK